MTNEQLVILINSGENVTENMFALWQQNEKYICKLAKKYINYAEIEDLKQEGYIGLYNAVEHYNADNGVLFLSYASLWIEQAMRRYIDNCTSVIRVPVYARNEVQQYKKFIREYIKIYGEEPTEREIAEFIGVDTKNLKRIKSNMILLNARSLNEPIAWGDENVFLEDRVASEQDIESDIIKKIDTAAVKKQLWKVVDELPDNMPEVIHCRYVNNMTLKESGKNLGITIEQARQMERKALNKLRLKSRSGVLWKYYEQYIEVPIRHVGMAEFAHTHTSEVEWAVLKREYDKN